MSRGLEYCVFPGQRNQRCYKSEQSAFLFLLIHLTWGKKVHRGKTSVKSSSVYLVVISSKCIIKRNYTPYNVTGIRFSVPKALVYLQPP